jgi:integrase
VDEIKAGLKDKPVDRRTFKQLAQFWLENRASQKKKPEDDRSILRTHLLPSFGELYLDQITTEHVDKYKTGKMKYLSPQTVRNQMTLLISMLNAAVDMKWLRYVPRIKKPKVPERIFRYLCTEEEIKKLLIAAREEDPGVMEVYAAAIYTGMRAGELCGIQWSDIDLDRRLITVQRSYEKSTKTDKIRHIPILDPLLPILREWRLKCHSPLWVFPSQTGTMNIKSGRILQDIFHRCIQRAHLSYITFHDLRHTFASHWVMRGGDIFRLQKILGHSDINMTMRYAHLAPDVFKEDYSRLGTTALPEGKLIKIQA